MEFDVSPKVSSSSKITQNDCRTTFALLHFYSSPQPQKSPGNSKFLACKLRPSHSAMLVESMVETSKGRKPQLIVTLHLSRDQQ